MIIQILLATMSLVVLGLALFVSKQTEKLVDRLDESVDALRDELRGHTK